MAGYAKNGDYILYENKWLQLRETSDGYVYAYEAKGRGEGVGVLAYRWRGEVAQIAGRYERCPCHRDGFALCALTGQAEPNEKPVETAVRELKEEAGIDAKVGEMQPLGSVRPGKQTDTTLYLFGIDVGSRDIGPALGDGTAGEVGAYCRWVSLIDACLSKDPVLVTMAVRALVLG